MRPPDRSLPLGRVLVRGRSMEPTLRDGDHLLVRWGGTPRPGRLVVVRWPGRPLSVKRAGVLTDDGWWVERDNPAEGVDSWQAGPVLPVDVLGIVLLRLWPLRRRGRRLSRG
jgi:phage repressor protein C with HTH and peptisase S24 domain